MKEQEHFINDIRYVVHSLKKDKRATSHKYNDEIFTIDPAGMKERFAMEYEQFFQMVQSRLHTDLAYIEGPRLRYLLGEYERLLSLCEQQLVIACKIKESIRQEYGLFIEDALEQIEKAVNRIQSLEADIVPTVAWLYPEEYETMITWIDEAQTKSEDIVRARKRILKVWKEEILEEEYLDLVDSFVKCNNGNFKLLKSSYWSTRKKLRSMFIEELELLTDQEYEVLQQNLKILKSSEAWMKENEETLYNVFGQAYRFEQTEFQRIRRQYDIVYSVLELCNVQKECDRALVDRLITKEDFTEFKNLVTVDHPYSADHCKQLLTEVFSWYEEKNQASYSVSELLKAVQNAMLIVDHLKTDYYAIYEKLRSEQEDLTIADIRKLVYQLERIAQKESWLKNHEAEIIELVGSMDNLSEKNLKNIPLEREEKAVFEAYHPLTQEEITSGDVMMQIIEKEQPLHINTLLKRTVSLTGASRVTKSLRLQAEQLIEALKAEGYEYENDCLWKGDLQSIRFRCNESNGVKREIGMIPFVELKSCIYRIVEQEGEIKTEEISKKVAQLLCLPRRNQSFHEIMEQAIFALKREGILVRHSGGWRV